MNEEDVKKLVELRMELIGAFNSCRDYKNNQNAIMKEREHARLINETIIRIDNILKNYVSFS